MTADWRLDGDLVRPDDADLEPDPPLDERWAGVFDHMIPAVIGNRGSGILGQAVKLMSHQGRRYVSRNPEQARQTVIAAMQMVAAQLGIEPGEVYPEGG